MQILKVEIGGDSQSSGNQIYVVFFSLAYFDGATATQQPFGSAPVEMISHLKGTQPDTSLPVLPRLAQG